MGVAASRRLTRRGVSGPRITLRTRRLFPVGAAEATLAHIEVIHRGRCSTDESGLSRRRE